MLAGRPSRTLLGPAVRRAAHQLLDAPLVFSDPIAVGLIPEADAETIRAQLADHQTAENPTTLIVRVAKQICRGSSCRGCIAWGAAVCDIRRGPRNLPVAATRIRP